MYLGAAHGLLGILYVLLQFPEFISPEHGIVLENTLDYVIAYKDHGNYKWTDHYHDNKTTFHWCHGIPGAVYTLTQAYKTLKKEKYLKEAFSDMELLWEKGLLKKSIGICHGITGNAFAFLHMYKFTKDIRYLQRAEIFAKIAIDSKYNAHMRPDTPLSLFEGLAGRICFFSDLLNPTESRFPAYEII